MCSGLLWSWLYVFGVKGPEKAMGSFHVPGFGFCVQLIQKVCKLRGMFCRFKGSVLVVSKTMRL